MMRRPPALARLLLRLVLERDAHEAIAGDLEEEFRRTAAGGRPGAARRRYWAEALASLAARPRRRATERAARSGGPGSRLMGEQLVHDVRYALRTLRRSPGFAAAAVLTLALGIGANAAVFSAVRSVLLAPLPFSDSERLVRLRRMVPLADGRSVQGSLTPRAFHAVREQSRLLEAVAAQRYQDLTLSGDGEPERVVGIGVSQGWLATLGVAPLLGRGFDHDEERAGSGSRVALLAHGFWQRRFGASPSVLGRSLRLNGEEYTVVGVMPREFRYPYNADLWHPLSFPPEPGAPADLNAPARMRAGVGPEQLAAELAAIGARLANESPDADGVTLAAQPFRDEFQRDPNRSITTLQLAVGFVLLIATANVASLLLARGAARTRELAVRAALGAGRGRQLRQLLTESLLLAALGGGAGIALAALATGWLEPLIPPRLGEVVQEVRLDPWVLALSVAVSAVAGMGFGLGPALGATRAGAAAALRGGGRATGAAPRRALDVLVVAEVALAALLLAGAGVMLQNLARLLDEDVGYDAAGLLKLDLGLPRPVYDDPGRRTALVRQLVERIDALPGVAAAGITSLQPIPRTRTNTGARVAIENAAADERLPVVNSRLVTPGWFRAVGLRTLRGRSLDPLDVSPGPPVVVVSEACARRLWGGEDPLGRRLKAGRLDDDAQPWLEVVGVVSDIGEPDDEIQGTIYRPYAQAAAGQPRGTWSTTSVSLLIRGEAPPAELVARVRQAVWDVDGSVPVFLVSAMADALAAPLADQRFGSSLLAGFGAFGLLMAALGTYGVMAFSVARRVPEFGVRLALGASPRALLRGVLQRALGLVATGLVLGALGAALLARLLAASMPLAGEVRPIGIAVATAVGLLCAGALASWLPARRAARTDPLLALRSE